MKKEKAHAAVMALGLSIADSVTSWPDVLRKSWEKAERATRPQAAMKKPIPTKKMPAKKSTPKPKY